MKTMKKLVVQDFCEPCTCNCDVVKLLEVTSSVPNNTYSFSLYQVMLYGGSGKFNYIIVTPEDKFPIAISKATAEAVIRNPEFGAYIVKDTWLKRYK